MTRQFGNNNLFNWKNSYTNAALLAEIIDIFSLYRVSGMLLRLFLDGLACASADIGIKIIHFILCQIIEARHSLLE